MFMENITLPWLSIACYLELKSNDCLLVEQIQNYFKIDYSTGLGLQLRATQLPGFGWATTTITAGAPTSILKQPLTTTGKKHNDRHFYYYKIYSRTPKYRIKMESYATPLGGRGKLFFVAYCASYWWKCLFCAPNIGGRQMQGIFINRVHNTMRQKNKFLTPKLKGVAYFILQVLLKYLYYV